MFRSGNPTMKAFEKPMSWDDLGRSQGGAVAVPGVRGQAAASGRTKTMTIGGTVMATSILLGLCAASAVFAWGFVTNAATQNTAMMITFGGMLAGLVLGLVISFVPRTAMFLSPVYAIAQGGFLAGISYVIATRGLSGQSTQAALGGAASATGMIFQAVTLTFAIMLGMLVAYAGGLIRIGGTMAKVILTAVIGLCLYSVAILLCNGLLGMGIPNLYQDASPIGIGFSLLIIGLASLCLVMDFQYIEQGVQTGQPKYMEWYGGFALLATLIWLYIEILRLLAKLRSNQ